MTARQFNRALETLGLDTHDAAAAVLGIGRRSIIRYANGQAAVPLVVSRLVALLIKHGIPEGFAR
jgi:hypothetical protein